MASGIQLIKAQLDELRKKHPYLYIREDKDAPKISGTIFFEDNGAKGKFDVEIELSKDYPTVIPLVKETKGDIPKKYHHNGEHFCLETPFRVWEIFKQDETLLNFVNNLVIPYLAIFIHSQGGKNPPREHAHGAEGVLADYKKRFKINDDVIAFKLLRILAERNYRGHALCPCGSKIKLRKCHGMAIFNIVVDDRFKRYDFIQDFLQIAIYLKKTDVIDDYSECRSEKVLRYIEQIKKKPQKKWNY